MKLNKIPSSIDDSYRRNRLDIYPDSGNLADLYGKYLSTHKSRIMEDVVIIEHFTNGTDNVLDVGAVPPIALAILKDRGFKRLRGVDIAPERFATCINNLGLDVNKVDIENEPLPFPDDYFDCVHFSEVFEHLRININFTASELARVTRPGGKLIVSTPNLRSVRGIWSLVAKGRSTFVCPDIFAEYEKLEKIGHMGHVREYTPRDVQDLFAHFQFTPRCIIGRSRRIKGVERIVVRAIPSLSSFFTIILEKVSKQS